MKVPFDRQRVVSSSALQMVDRSIVVSELNLDRDVGVHLFSRDFLGLDGLLAYSLAVFGGDGRNRLAEAYGLLYAARLEVRPFGSFDDYIEADLRREPRPKLSIGLSAAHNQNTNRPRSTLGEPFADARFDYDHLNADLLFKWRGLSIMGEWIWRRADRDTRVGEVNGVETTFRSRSAWGAFAQVGQMIVGGFELSARYGYLTPMRGAELAVREQHELGGGASYYFSEHNLKIQADYFRVSETSFDFASHQARVQAQLFF